MNKLVIALASGAAAATVAMADNDHGNVNFAEPREAWASDNGGSTFTSSYSELRSISHQRRAIQQTDCLQKYPSFVYTLNLSPFVYVAWILGA